MKGLTRAGAPRLKAAAQQWRQRGTVGDPHGWDPPPRLSLRDAAGLAEPAFAPLAALGAGWLAARTLDQGAAGAFFAVTAAFTLCSAVVEAGSGAGLAHFIAVLRARVAPSQEYQRCLRTALVPVGIVALVAATALWTVAPQLSTVLGRGGAPGGYVTLLRVVAVFLPLRVLCDALLAATRGWSSRRPTVVIGHLLRPAAQLLAFAALAIATVHDPALFTLGWALPYVPAVLLAWYAVRRLLRGVPVRPGAPPADTAVPRRWWLSQDRGRDAQAALVFWRGAMPRAASRVARLALGRLDPLVLAAMSGLRAVAVFAVATRVVLAGRLVGLVASRTVRPYLAESLHAGDRDGARYVYQMATGWVVAVSWPLYLFLAALPSLYLGLFGPAYRSAGAAGAAGAAGRVVTVLACAMLVSAACGMVHTLLDVAGRTRWNRAGTAAAVAVNVAVDVALIPRLSALGAAVGLGAAIVVHDLVPLVQVAVRLRLQPFGPGTFAAGGAALICFGVLPLLATRLADAHLRVGGLVVGGPFAGQPLRAALVATALGAGAYLVALFRLRQALRFDVFLALRHGRGAND